MNTKQAETRQGLITKDLLAVCRQALIVVEVEDEFNNVIGHGIVKSVANGDVQIADRGEWDFSFRLDQVCSVLFENERAFVVLKTDEA